jgi:hypothetical protein
LVSAPQLQQPRLTFIFLSTGNQPYHNLFLGVGAGAENPQDGTDNSFIGTYAGYYNSTGNDNTFGGACSGYENTTGGGNTFIGWAAGYYNTTGGANAFYGINSGVSNTSGSSNTFAGVGAGYSNTTGSYNTYYGTVAGFNNESGSNNIYIGSLGGSSDSSTIRIGGDVGSGYGPQTAVYIAGIFGSTSSSGVPVYVNSDGQLGTQTSSMRFKEQVRDMGDSTSSLMKLRPVTFVYKRSYDNGEHTQQYGLIAEEVAEVYPDLVAYGSDGQPYSVRYQFLSTMLLNEVQKQYRRAEAEAEVIKGQQQKIDDLERRLVRLEKVVSNQVEMFATK